MMARGLLLVLVVVLTASGCRPRPATVEVSVFFTRSEGTAIMLAEVKRTIPRGASADLVAGALRAMLAGPTAQEQAQGLHSSIPSGTRLRGVRLQDGIVRADFSRDLESGGGSASMLGRFWQIVYTATQFREAPRVRILIDGQEREAMGGEGVIIEQPISRPASPPRF